MDDRLFKRLTASVKEAGAIRRKEVSPSRRYTVDEVNVAAIRHDLGKSQEEFARLIRVSVATVRNWEQGRRRPRGPARALLKVASVSPETVELALGEKS